MTRERPVRRMRVAGFAMPADIEHAVRRLVDRGAVPYLVGGAVRDLLLGTPVKDYDFEVYGIGAAALEETLRELGRVQTVGESFGVTKLWTRGGHEVDFALPRREAKTGRGHRDFQVAVDPAMDPGEACLRRDFTFNALLLDCGVGEVIDYVGGIADLEARVIRHVSDHFGEDPLRPLRAMQFAARFDMTLAPETAAVCAGMLEEGRGLRFERVLVEWEKWARAPHPAAGLRALADMGWLPLFDALWALQGVPQDPRHHPEGWSLVEVGVMASDPGGACSAETGGTDGGFTIGKIDACSATADAVIPRLGSASITQAAVVFASDGFTMADFARVLAADPSPILAPAALAHPERLVWSVGSAASDAREVVGVVFQISLRSMPSVMGTSIDEFEVFRAIIHAVAIYVMHVLFGKKWTSKFELHHDSMNGVSPFVARPGGARVSAPVTEERAASVDRDVLFYFELSIDRNDDVGHVQKHAPVRSLYQVNTGSVWTHTLLAVDAAACIAIEDGLDPDARMELVLAALLHDAGKAAATEVAADGTITAKDHAECGEAPAFRFLSQIGMPIGVRARVCALVREHMAHLSCPEPSKRAVRRLMERLKPATLDALARLVRADGRARPPVGGGDPLRPHVELARAMGIREDDTIHPILKGRHLVALGVRPGPAIGQILKQGFQAQLDGAFEDEAGATQWAVAALAKDAAPC